jgi:PDZ domain-containing protein
MSRRTATLLVAGALLLACVGVALLLPVPFVTTSPGPTVDTLGSTGDRPVVRIEGRRTYPTRGELELTTVRVSSPGSRLSLVEAVRAWFDPDRELLPRDVVYPPEESVAQVERENAEQMQTSQQDAVVAALREVGVSVPRTVVVQSIVRGAPALGRLQAGDTIRAVNGRSITAPEQVGAALQSTPPGKTARFRVVREGSTTTVVTPTEAAEDDPDLTMVGIAVGVGYDLPFEVNIDVGADIGGPSAGTMFALAIVDKLTPGALTGGAVVAGTGAISYDGVVGEIGGIQQKILGAADSGADIFLVPRANCAEALGADAGDMRLVQVATLHGAVRALQVLAEDPDASVPACAA